jgi:hypothetical protein
VKHTTQSGEKAAGGINTAAKTAHYEVIDGQGFDHFNGHYATRAAAMRRADALNLGYGAHRYDVAKVTPLVCTVIESASPASATCDRSNDCGMELPAALMPKGGN